MITNVPRGIREKFITNVKIMTQTLMPTLCHQTFFAKITENMVITPMNVMHPTLAEWLASQYNVKQKTSSHLQDIKRT